MLDWLLNVDRGAMGVNGARQPYAYLVMMSFHIRTPAADGFLIGLQQHQTNGNGEYGGYSALLFM